jgi:nanoRNase/pAp phosphatase (c-di-AMP/oligoRNAs hydrolase)
VAGVQGSDGYKKILGNLRQFSNVTAFLNSDTGQVSFRSDFMSFNVLEIAQKFGGGGHVRAAGCTVNADDLLNETDRLVSLLLAKIENPRTKWIM